MKKTIKLGLSKEPVTIIIDKRLDKLNEVVLFPEKVERANRLIAKIGLPKQLK